MFIDGLTEDDEQIKEFAIGGICNCVCGILYILFELIDDFFSEVILEDKAAMKSIIRLLSSTNENTLISTLTTLFYLSDFESSYKCIITILLVCRY